MFSKADNAEILSVKALIKIKLNTALKSLPPELSKFISDFGIVSGGISASIIHNEKVNDIDIYLKTEKAIDTFNQAILHDSVKDHISDVDENYSNVLVKGKMVTSCAVTFGCNIQVITMYASIARTTFDFIHTMPYYDILMDTYFISRAEYDSIISKKLIANPNGTTTPKRIKKFIDRGWSYDENQ